CHDSSIKGINHAAVLITSDDASLIDSAVLSAYLARQFSPDITLLTNGLFHVEQHHQILAAMRSNFKLDNKPIKSFETLGTSVTVHFANGTTTEYGFIAHKPKAIVGGPFAEQLDLEMRAGGSILVEGDFQETSIRGVFAAGDCASLLKHESVGVGSGLQAGMAANLQIAEDDRSV
ncbi:hypothetical protein IL306_010616, partial [Fusarium sp. DS 682]